MVGIGCGPAPEAVCDRLQALISAELTAQDAAEFDHAQCIADIQRREAVSGQIPREHVDCILAAKTLPAGLDAYPKPFAGYNDVLDHYSAWLVAQRAQGWDVIDAHGLMSASLARLRACVAKRSMARASS